MAICNKKELRNEGMGSEIIGNIIEYFIENYTVDTIKVGVIQDNMEEFHFGIVMDLLLKEYQRISFKMKKVEIETLLLCKGIASVNKRLDYLGIIYYNRKWD